MKYICVTMDNQYYGSGDTLEEAHDDLLAFDHSVGNDEVNFFEVTKLEVEFRIVKKEVPAKKKGTC